MFIEVRLDLCIEVDPSLFVVQIPFVDGLIFGFMFYV